MFAGSLFNFSTVVRLICTVGIGVAALVTAQGQGTDEPELTPAERNAKYEALAREVDAWEKQGSILKKVVQLVKPTVVHIEAEKQETSKFGRKRAVEEAGSGVIIDYKGKNYILTNRHVIRAADSTNIKVKLSDGRTLNPSKVWMDSETDVAVMAVAGEGLVAARVGDSDKIDIGDFVLAVGSPFGLSHSVTYGIISAKGRRDLDLGDEGVRFQDFMQTDAAINPGNSGGPLISLRGEVIGLNNSIASTSGHNEGIGFTIPANMVMAVARQLIETGTVVRAYLGVSLDRNFTTAVAAKLGLPKARGAHVTGITPKSPAEAAKLQIDDVILEFNQVRVQDDNHLMNLVSLTEVGRDVPIVILREKQTLRLNVPVSNRSKFER